MADKQGYIKLFRKIVDWEWYTEVNTCKLFLHMLIMANHDTQKWRGEVIERGTFITSYASLSNETGLTIREIRTAIKHLLSTKDIEVKATSQNTRIYIVKYDLYQKSDITSGKGKNNRISDEQEILEDVNSSDDTPCDNQTTELRQSNDTPSDKRATTNKNVKKLKNVKNESIKDIVEYLNSKIGADFKQSTKSTRENINARILEGYTVDDFKLVIDKKYNEWFGTDMEKYLCPSTLFRPANFEKYLNQKEVSKKNETAEYIVDANGDKRDKYGTLVL